MNWSHCGTCPQPQHCAEADGCCELEPSKQKRAAAPYSDQKNWSNTYLTEPRLIKALGSFSVDVCCPPTMPWSTARRMLHEGQTDGLTAPWGNGRAWMNPPYRGVLAWAQRFVNHGVGICLLNGRSIETRATQLVMANASGVFFLGERLVFYRENGEPWTGKDGKPAKWFPSILIGLGHSDAVELARLPKKGFKGVYLRGPRWEGS